MENGGIADIAAVTRPNFMGGGFGYGMGGLEGLIALLVVAGIFNGGFGGFGGGGGFQQGFNTQNILSKLDGITYGISDATYAVSRDILENRFAAQQCCCDTQRAIDGVNYNNAKNTCDIVNAIHYEGDTTRKMLVDNKIEALQQKITDLTVANNAKDNYISQLNQSNYIIEKLQPTPKPAYVVQNPNGCGQSFGFGFGCGGCNGFNSFA